jgi:hypothetical protein
MNIASLLPEIKGALSSMEESAISAVQAGEKVRTTVSLDPTVALAAVRAASREHRDFSGLCGMALREYVERNPGPASDLIELFAKLGVALERRPAIRADLEKIARAATRAKRVRMPL